MDEELMNFTTEDDIDVDNEDVIESEVEIEDLEQDIEAEESVSVIGIELADEIEISLDESAGWVGGDSTKHYSLSGRDEPNQHPIQSIIGLRDELDDIEALQTVYSDKIGSANYYKWNIGSYDEAGYFVSLVPKTSTIQICDGADIFGITVDRAGFIGGQNADAPRNNTYGLVVTSGLVDVRCESDVAVGDYIVSNAQGVGIKTNSGCGYKVVAVNNKQGVNYASISLGVQACTTDVLGHSVQLLEEDMKDAQINIASAIHAANEAYQKASEAGDISEEAIKNVLEALDRVDGVDDQIDNMNDIVSSTQNIATQARAIAESAVTSAESLRNEAIKNANEALADTSELRTEFEEMVAEMDAKLNNAALDLEATKESITSTKDDLQQKIDDATARLNEAKKDLDGTKNDLQSQINDATRDFEDLTKDLEPLVTWPKGSENPTGISGFVARADEDAVTLASVTKLEGEFGQSLSGFVQEATADNATVSAIASYKGTDADGNSIEGAAGLIAQVNDNTSELSAIVNHKFTKNNGSTVTGLAGLNTYVNENESNVSLVADRVKGKYVVVPKYPEGDSDKIAALDTSKIYYTVDEYTQAGGKKYVARIWIYVEEAWVYVKGLNSFIEQYSAILDKSIVYYFGDTIKYYMYHNGTSWTITSNAYTAGLPSAIGGIQVEVDDNTASIEMITHLTGDFGDSLAGFISTATAENAEIKALAEYGYTDEDGNNHYGAAGIMAEVDKNKSAIEAITGKDGSIAGLQAQVDSNKASVTTLASQTIGSYITVDTWSATGKDVSKIYYAKDTKYYYYYKNKQWIKTKNTHEAGLDGTIAGVQSVADDNKSQLDAMVAYDKDGKSALAGMTTYVDANSTNFSTLAKYSNENSGNSGIAGLVADVNDNTSELSAIADYEFTKNDGTTVTGFAGLNAFVNENASNISLVTNRVNSKYFVVSKYPEGDNDKIGELDTNQIYYSEHSYTSTLDGETKYVVCVWQYDGQSWNYIQTFNEFVNNADAVASLKQDTIYYFGGHLKYYLLYNNSSWKVRQDISEVGLISAIAGIQANADDNASKIESLTSWQGDTNDSMARIEQKADENGASITSLVSSIDKYSIGEYSQAYGLTLEQARSILKTGMIYIPTENHNETYGTTVYEFTNGSYYEWKSSTSGLMWVESIGKVWFGSEQPTGNNYSYWYNNTSLFILKDDKWVPVTTLAGNVNNRITSMIRQEVDEISLEVTNTAGAVVGLDDRLTDAEAKVNSYAYWPTGENKYRFNLSTIDQSANKDGSSLALAVVNKDGEQIIKGATIVLNQNNKGSFININADNILMTGTTTFLTADGTNENGKTVIDGSRIITGSIKADQIDATNLHVNAANIDGTITANNIDATTGSIGGWSIGESSIYFTSPYNIRFDIDSSTNTSPWISATAQGDTKFKVTKAGILEAKGAIIEGNITANSGTIGGCTISEDGRLEVKTTNGNSIFSAGKNSVQLGGWNVDYNSIYAGALGDENSMWLCRNGTGTYAQIGTSPYVPGWCIAVGNKFGVDNRGILYAEDAVLSGEIRATNGYFGCWSIGTTEYLSTLLESISTSDLDGNHVHLTPTGILYYFKSENCTYFRTWKEVLLGS